MYSTIELFAGAGGLALGVEKAGFDTIGLIEFDRDACDTLEKNRPDWWVICDDIANISKLDLEDYFGIKKGELDLLSGGAPCQTFSYAGKRLGLEDAHCQSFPDDWEFCGNVMSQYKQVGNAVPVNLGYEVARTIYEALDKEVKS